MLVQIERLFAGGASVALPDSGAKLEVTRFSAGALHLEHEGGKTTGRVSDLAVELAAHLAAGSFQMASEGIALDGLELAPGRIALGRLAVPLTARQPASGLELQAGLLARNLAAARGATTLGSLALSDIRIVRPPLVLTIDGVSLPTGATLVDGVLAVPEVRLERARVAVDPLALGAATQGNAPLDLGFLDAINGQVNVDITIDVTAPVLGRRRATHRMRLPIVDGTINFKTLEKNLAFLEDSVLDFEVQGDTLILEKDLPLVPFDNTTLVRWHLDEQEQNLAREKRVRLRRLLAYELPEDEDHHAIEVELHRLVLADIDVSLDMQELAVIALGGAGQVDLGSGERPGLLELSASGELHHDAAGPAEPTEVTLAIKEVNGRVPGVRLAGLLLQAGAFHLGAVERASVTFAGLQPQRLELELTGGWVRDLRLGLPG